MTVLIIDDQISVLKGITKGVHFDLLGISEVRTASCAAEAREIIEIETIDIVLSDIEMPGENGLELNEWIAARYPSIIRILLTSHADFTYAQTSIKLGCFDYIVQPAPYDEIEKSLSKAIDKLTKERQKERYYNSGLIYSAHKHEMNDRIVFNLYSENAENVAQSLDALNQMGYPLNQNSFIRIMILDIYSYAGSSNSVLFDIAIRENILESLHTSRMDGPVCALITFNRHKQFVVLLFCNDDTLGSLSNLSFSSFYQNLTEKIDPAIACYVGQCSTFPFIREEVFYIHNHILNNVSKKSGLFFVEKEKASEEHLSIDENISRWKYLLDARQFSSLETSILTYIDFISAVNKANLKTLCDLHQRLTQIFFSYAYQHNLDIMKLFTEHYRYNDYMDGFKDIPSIRTSVKFIISAIADRSSSLENLNDVQRAKDYILNNIAQNLSVKDVADYVHLSPEYFTRLFKKETGQNIKNYILQVKVDVARDLLGNPNIPVSMIALELGYNNFSHFTQIFKKFENVTPTEYRKNLLERV